ncbi:MAG: LicD family protein [Acetatifactor sp.]|nr:LicD family protein [Acetatifactor sp.]
MFEYNSENLRKLQLAELSALKEVDRICRKNNIKYIIEGGTLLGAVRHGGFIPWDDDIDLRMLRADYDKFCEVCEKELDKKFFLQTYKTDPNFRWIYARILINGTKFLRAGHEHQRARNGIFIDIFPDDNLPEKGFGRWECTVLSLLCRKILYSEVGMKSAESIIKRIGFTLLNKIPKEWAHHQIEYLSKRYRNSDTRLVRCLGWGSDKETKGVLKEWLQDTSEIEFEGIRVSCPLNYHNFLVYNFGEDYMELPPADKRKVAHPASEIYFG